MTSKMVSSRSIGVSMAELWPTRRKNLYLGTLLVQLDVGWLLSSMTPFEREFYGE